MVCNPLLPEFLLFALLWLGVYIWRWQRGHATKSLPAHRTQRTPQGPKPFAGLTHKPPCEACEQHQPHRARPPLSPPPVLLAPKRGRPRTVVTHHQYCPEKTCAYSGWVGQGNIRANGHPGSRAWRQLHCVVCDTYFLETHGTLFYGKPDPAERLVRAVAALAEGLGIRAVARVFEVDPNTVLAWCREAAT